VNNVVSFNHSPFTLIVSDNGSINKYLCPGNALENLLHLPTRSAHDYMTLSQVEIQDGREQLPFNANFLAAVIRVCFSHLKFASYQHIKKM
jgi:hypothetical protein